MSELRRRVRYAMPELAISDKELDNVIARELIAAGGNVAFDSGLRKSAAAGDIIALLPRLRLFARVLTGDVPQADLLVELALEKAISAADELSPDADRLDWLERMIEEIAADGGAALLRHQA